MPRARLRLLPGRERRRAQRARSSLVEAVELAGVGAATSLLAAMVVLGVGREIGLFDAAALSRDPATYLILHPFRGLGSVVALFALSCGMALGAARAVFAKDPRVFDPGGSAWGRVLLEDRPRDRPEVAVAVELRDGRRIMGRVRTFSSELEDSRELALIGPLAAMAGASAPSTPMPGDFMLLREEQILSITGNYIAQQPAATEPLGG